MSKKKGERERRGRKKTSAKICRYILSLDIIVHNSYNLLYIYNNIYNKICIVYIYLYTLHLHTYVRTKHIYSIIYFNKIKFYQLALLMSIRSIDIFCSVSFIKIFF